MSAICRYVEDHYKLFLERADGELTCYELVYVDPKSEPHTSSKRAAHDFLRRRVVGKQIVYEELFPGKYSMTVAPSGNTDEDLTCELLRHGLVQPPAANVRVTEPPTDVSDEKCTEEDSQPNLIAIFPEPYLRAYETGAAVAKAAHTEIPEPDLISRQQILRKLIDQKSEISVVVDKVIKGNTLECYLPDHNFSTIISMTGVSTPGGDLGQEAKEFMIARILQRDIILRVDGQRPGQADGDPCVTYGTFLHRQKGLVSEYLLKEGLASIDDKSVKLLRLAQQEVLKNAQNSASSKNLKIWAPTSIYKKVDKSDGATASKAAAAASQTLGGDLDAPFHARIADIVSGTCLVLIQGKEFKLGVASAEEPVTPFSKHHIVYLSHIRCANRGWLSASREVITKFVGTDRPLYVEIDFARYPPLEFAGQVSDEYGRLHYASIYKVGSDNHPTGASLGMELVKAGLASVEFVREGQRRASRDYEVLLSTYRSLQNTIAPPVAPKFNDLIGPANLKRAKQMFPSLQKEPKLTVIIARVVMGHKFRAYVPNYKAMVSLTLSGITCPQPARFDGRGNDEEEFEQSGQPFSDECVKWSQLKVLFRKFTAKISNCDPTGTYGAILYYPDGRTLQEIMLKEGFALVFDRYPGPDETVHREYESQAIKASRGIWSLAENIVFFGRGEDSSRTVNLIGKWGNVNISHCESCQEVYIQKHAESKDLIDMGRLIAAEMNSTQADTKLSEYPPKKNAILLAKYDDAWFRARVLNFDEVSQSVVVFFLDYGNQSNISSPEDFAELPPACNVIAYAPLALKVALAYIKSPSIDPQSLEASCDMIMDFGEEQTCECECIAVNRSNGVPQVIIEKHSRDLINELLLAGLVKLQPQYGMQKRLTTPKLQQYSATERIARQSLLNIWKCGDIGDTDEED